MLNRFRKSGLPSKYIKTALYSYKGKENYEAYLYRISIAVFNIYRTNNFIQNYMEGTVSLHSIINRDLTNEEITEGPDTVESLIAWLPPTEILDTMRKANPVVYEQIIRNGSEITDISVINTYEKEIGKKMTFLNKKLALIELVKLKSWQKYLAMLETIDESKRLMFLIKHRNRLRSINNITAIIRLTTFNNLHYEIRKCGIQTNVNIVEEEYAENIEIACYSLSINLNEYKQISENILSSKVKLSKLILEFVAGNTGPIDIIANIAELYLDFGKTQNGINVIKKAKLGEWDGIKMFPTELLSGIKKVANNMIDAKERKQKGDQIILQNPELGIQEFKIIKDSEGNFMVKQIDKPIIIDEKKRTIDMFLKIIKNNYIPRINITISEEIQKVIDKNELTEQIIEEMNSRELINLKDLEKLKSLTYSQLLDINANVYREPMFVDVVPISMANEGVKVYPIKSRWGFLIGGKFPFEARAYRYRDSEGKIRTRLEEICEWIGNKQNEIVYPDNISIYSKEEFNEEIEMMKCVKKLVDSEMFIKIYKEDVVNSKEILSKVITEFDMYKSITESAIKYFNEFGGNRALFVNGGTKEEYESFLNYAMYINALQKLLGVTMLTKVKEVYTSRIAINDMIDVSILKNGGQEIYRKLYKSKTEMYPIPIGYDNENYPIYSKKQKDQLAFLIER